MSLFSWFSKPNETIETVANVENDETITTVSENVENVETVATVENVENVLTENGALAHKLGACLNFFACCNRTVDKNTLIQMFCDAWNENPKIAMKILWNLRDVHSKGEKSLSITLFSFIKKRLPNTYALCLPIIPEHGCWKDIIKLMCEDVDGLNYNFEQISPEIDLICNQISHDLVAYDREPPESVSLCSKWLPAENSKNEKERKIAKILASEFYMRNIFSVGVCQPNREYRKLRSSLNERIRIVETMLSQKQIENVLYEELPAKALKKYTRAFKTRDGDRYEEFLDSVKSGKVSVKTTGIHVHELFRTVKSNYSEIVELQFQEILKKFEDSDIKNVLPVIDVSGSMAGEPMDVAIGLGAVCSMLCSGSFQNKFITFSEDPQLQTVDPTNLKTIIDSISHAGFGFNTNFVKVFDLVLQEAIKSEKQNLPEKIIVFTDMQFDSANNDVQSPFEEIKTMYKNFELVPPKFVFWNLRGVPAFPTDGNSNDATYLSGYSQELLRFVTESVTPTELMNEIIDRYEPYVSSTDINTRL